jgi:hypothetical protein
MRTVVTAAPLPQAPIGHRDARAEVSAATPLAAEADVAAEQRDPLPPPGEARRYLDELTDAVVGHRHDEHLAGDVGGDCRGGGRAVANARPQHLLHQPERRAGDDGGQGEREGVDHELDSQPDRLRELTPERVQGAGEVLAVGRVRPDLPERAARVDETVLHAAAGVVQAAVVDRDAGDVRDVPRGHEGLERPVVERPASSARSRSASSMKWATRRRRSTEALDSRARRVRFAQASASMSATTAAHCSCSTDSGPDETRGQRPDDVVAIPEGEHETHWSSRVFGAVPLLGGAAAANRLDDGECARQSRPENHRLRAGDGAQDLDDLTQGADGVGARRDQQLGGVQQRRNISHARLACSSRHPALPVQVLHRPEGGRSLSLRAN